VAYLLDSGFSVKI